MGYYVAVHNETGEILRGAKGQIVMDNANSFARSLGQNSDLMYEARVKGVNPKDLYTLKGIDLVGLIAPSTMEPLILVETVEEGSDWQADYVHVRAFIGDNVLFSDGVGDLSECPEDANTNRDLSFIKDVAGAIKGAHKAGLEGRELKYSFLDGDE